MSAVPEDLPLAAKSEELAKALRAVGLYEDQSQWISQGERPDEFSPPQEHQRNILVMDLLIGDLAFSKRVQNPEQHDVDAEFRAMMGGLETSEFDDTRNEIIRKLEQGLNPFEED